VTQTSRLILTGQAQDQGLTQATFAQALCSHVAVLFTCSNIMIDVQVCSSFCTANTGTPTLTYNGLGQVTNIWQYNPGSPGQIVVVRAMYQWPVFLGPLGFNLSNLANGDRLLMATATFKNEPYQ
jgi:Flp pilus assembly protein TadG